MYLEVVQFEFFEVDDFGLEALLRPFFCQLLGQFGGGSSLWPEVYPYSAERDLLLDRIDGYWLFRLGDGLLLGIGGSFG